jgi:hypothetical protein
MLTGRELARLHQSSASYQLALCADAAGAAAVTVILCGAADEDAALAALSHLPELADVGIRIRAARWLRDGDLPGRAAVRPAGPPAGTTALGEFPVLLAESLVEAYQSRITTYPQSAPRGLARMLIELAGRLADLGRAEQALAAAQRAVLVTGQLLDKLDLPARAAASLRRAEELARRPA